MRQGEQTAKKYGFTSLPVDVFRLARDLEISVEAMPPSPDIPLPLGVLEAQENNKFAIIYNVSFDKVGIERFSIAHELSHYFLPGHIDTVFADGKYHESRAGFVSNDKYEREADCFAAGLLMPSRLFKNAMRTAGEGLVAIGRLADRCQTSLLATAIRFVQLNDAPIAIVVSTKDRIDYCFMSEELRNLDGIDWIRKNYPLPKNTATFAFNQDADRIRSSDRADGFSDLQDWFGGRRSSEIKEEVIGLGRYGKTLTVLTATDPSDLEEIEEEDRLVESWKARF